MLQQAKKGIKNMGLVDAFSKEDRVEITISQFHDLMKETEKTELILNGLEAEVSPKDLVSIFAPERKSNIELNAFEDAKNGYESAPPNE